MRVLTFVHSYAPGGVERVALRLVRAWRAAGVDAPLFVGRAEGAMAADVGRDLACRVGPRLRLMPRRWETLRMILALPAAIRAERPDLLFCAGNTYLAVALAMKLLLGGRCPPIVAKISNDLDRRDKSPAARFLRRSWLRLAACALDRVIAMEAAMVPEIAAAFGVPPGEVVVVPDPSLSDALIARLRGRAAGARTAPGRRFVAVGRLAAQKNLPLMLHAFARAAGPDDRLTLIGDGPERARLAVLADRLGVTPQIAFLGYLPDPAALLPDHDVLLLSSDYEGVPAVILEALAAGIGIVATDCGRSMAALLGHGRLGALVPPRDVAAFAAAIARADGAQDAALSLAQARRFTIERAADRYLPAMDRASPRPDRRQIVSPAAWG